MKFQLPILSHFRDVAVLVETIIFKWSAKPNQIFKTILDLSQYLLLQMKLSKDKHLKPNIGMFWEWEEQETHKFRRLQVSQRLGQLINCFIPGTWTLLRKNVCSRVCPLAGHTFRSTPSARPFGNTPRSGSCRWSRSSAATASAESSIVRRISTTPWTTIPE